MDLKNNIKFDEKSCGIVLFREKDGENLFLLKQELQMPFLLRDLEKKFHINTKENQNFLINKLSFF